MRYVSLFSGVEAASVAWSRLGWEPLAFAEVDEFPSAVLAHRFPDVPNLGDVCKVDWKDFHERYGAVDVLIGGSPCFPAGTLVLCESGFKPIEQVEVGDKVVTHKGRLREVLRTGSKVADTIVLKGQGSVGIECTPNHPFYSREKHRVWNNARREYLMTYDEQSEWRDAKNMEGKFWLNVCNVEQLPIPAFPASGRGEHGKGYIEGFEFTPEFFYFVGRWLGDGWANAHKRKGRKDSWMKRVYVCCSHAEAEELEAKLDATGLHFCMNDNGATVRFTCSSTQLHDWLIGNFGVHADGKNVPAWCFGMEADLRREMLQGYLDADGTKVENGNKSTTINRKLSLGVKMLAGTLGITTSVTLSRNDRKAVIEGREVNERPNYVSSHYTNYRSAFFADCGFYGLVRNVSEGRENVTVYNLEVADDNSYTADAVAVHNCQSFSIAGSRTGLEGASGLMWQFCRAIRELVEASGGGGPRYVLWENVPGALSSGPKGQKGEDFGCLLRELEKCGYGLAWRILDSQFARIPDGSQAGFAGPVPQRRRRVFLVGSLGTDGAGDILFERTCLQGNHPKGREAREALAGGAEGGAGVGDSAGFKYHAGGTAKGIGYEVDSSPTLTADYHQPAVLTPWDVQSKRVNTPNGTSPTLPSGTGEGMNIQPIVMTTANTLDTADKHDVAFAQNTRDEVRLFGGDGLTVGALAAQPGMKQTSYVCMQDGQTNGGIPDGSQAGFAGPVPQRRRRVFLVGSLGTDGAGDILFERTCLRGDHPKGREAREALAEHLEGSPGMGDSAGFCRGNSPAAGGIGYEVGISPTLRAGESGTNMVPGVVSLTTANMGSANGGNTNGDDVAYTVDTTNSNAVAFASMTQCGDIAGTLICRADSSPCADRGHNIVCMGSQQGRAAVYENVCPTITSAAGTSGNNQPVVCMESAQQCAVIEVDQSPTLNASHEQPIVCAADDNGKTAVEEDMCGALKVGGGAP